MARRFHVAMLGWGALIAGASAQAQDIPWPVRLRQDMDRVTQVEWRLRQAAGALCPSAAADVGVMFDDRRAYRKEDWPLLASTVALGDRPVVVAVAAGGAAAMAGLAVGDEIEAIGGKPVAEIAARRKAGALVGEALLEEIAATPQGRSIAFAIRRGGATMTRTVHPAQHCAARLVLEANRAVDAHSDVRNVSISTGLATLARSDDELALAAGHELAHIVHRDRKGGGIGLRRRMEDAADSLGLQLIHCAGYDASRGIVLFQRLHKRDWLGFLRAPTHRSFGKRVERLKAEIPTLSCPPRAIPAHDGPADDGPARHGMVGTGEPVPAAAGAVHRE